MWPEDQRYTAIIQWGRGTGMHHHDMRTSRIFRFAAAFIVAALCSCPAAFAQDPPSVQSAPETKASLKGGGQNVKARVQVDFNSRDILLQLRMDDDAITAMDSIRVGVGEVWRIRSAIETDGDAAGIPTNLLQATLVAPDFEIEPRAQYRLGWSWEVKARTPGLHTVIIRLEADNGWVAQMAFPVQVDQSLIGQLATLAPIVFGALAVVVFAGLFISRRTTSITGYLLALRRVTTYLANR